MHVFELSYFEWCSYYFWMHHRAFEMRQRYVNASLIKSMFQGVFFKKGYPLLLPTGQVSWTCSHEVYGVVGKPFHCDFQLHGFIIRPSWGVTGMRRMQPWHATTTPKPNPAHNGRCSWWQPRTTQRRKNKPSRVNTFSMLNAYFHLLWAFSHYLCWSPPQWDCSYGWRRIL